MYDLAFFSVMKDIMIILKQVLLVMRLQEIELLMEDLVLNTPIVIYSWDTVVDALIKENIVTVRDNVYYITDMNKLINYILRR